ncbi:MAG: hypothetical protein CMJ94_04540 [Planctomycetes bacterium]|nr:hypothetical protein [Planctomycetota bacterium]
MITSLLLAAAAQQVFLDEDFSGGVFPPPGWGEVIYAIEPGWTAGFQTAFHDNYSVLSDSVLFTPPMDLSAASEVYLHLDFGQRYGQSRSLNAVEYSLDGGITRTELYALRTLESGGGQRLELDLAALAGLSNVRLAFHYEGWKANEWWLERVLVDDQPATGTPPWPQLPAQFQDIRVADEDFEGLGGAPSPWMSLNSVDPVTRAADPAGWVNFGNLAPVVEAYEGSSALELGLAPGQTGPHLVANALILAIDGSGFAEVDLVLHAKHFAEETHGDDGVFLSADGLTWFPLVLDWSSLSKGSADWFRVAAPLQDTPVPIDGRFYLAFAQADDSPFGTTDGVILDEIQFLERRASWTYEILNLQAGSMCTLQVTGVQRTGALIQLLYSLTGPGPTRTAFGTASLSRPILDLGAFTPDAQGNISAQRFVPPGAAGLTIWSQAVELAGSDVWWGPLLTQVVQ